MFEPWVSFSTAPDANKMRNLVNVFVRFAELHPKILAREERHSNAPGTNGKTPADNEECSQMKRP